jgi:hypothetical protein
MAPNISKEDDIVAFVTVELKGGKTRNMGNVFALNSQTGNFGPICDDDWSIEDVSQSFSTYSNHSVKNKHSKYSARRLMGSRIIESAAYCD